jgi:hypothetical protein
LTDPNPVQPAIVVVPDGSDQNVVRLSLKVTPFRPEASTGIPAASPVALENWPDAVAALAAGRIRIDVAGIQDLNTLRGARATVGHYLPIEPVGSAAKGAMALWRLTFPGSDIATLWNQLANQEGSTSTTSKPLGQALAPRIDSAQLGDGLIESRTRSLKARIKALGSARSEKAAPNLGLAPESLDAPITEQEAWALPVRARGPLAKLRESELARRRTAAFQTALAPHLSKAAARPRWQGARSHAMLEAIHTAELLEGNSDPALDAAVRATRPVGSVDVLASRMESLAIALNTAAAPAQDDNAPDPERDARRKLASILNYPTIAKYLCMSFTIEIPRQEWNAAVGRLGGNATAVSASFGSAITDAGTAWTAVADLPPTPHGSPSYFGPADPAEIGLAPVAERKFVRGMLDLGAQSKHTPGEPRYSLQIINPVGSALRHSAFSARRFEALLAGTPAENEQPELAGRGIALLDRDFIEDATVAKKREGDLGSPGSTKVLFANDLVNGYRPAVGIALRTGETVEIGADRWRSLVARQISYGANVDSLFISKYRNPEQEHGHVRSVVSEQNGTKLVHQELFVWTGDSLGVPSPDGEEKNELTAQDAFDLPVNIAYGLPMPAPGIGLAPLREGRSYAFGVSASFVNGCGPTVGEAIEAHSNATDTKHIIGSKAGKSFRFVRSERIPPPVVLLRDGTKIVTTRELARLKGENLTTLVIRKGDGNRAQRYLFPERIEFDRAEQQNMFGEKDGDVPKGALTRVALTRTKLGAFPRAVGGGIDADDPGPGDTSARESRGAVAHFGDPDDVVAAPYYPDSYSRGIWTRFTPKVPASGAKLADMSNPVGYRQPNEPAINCRPVLLELKHGKESDAIRVSIDQNDSKSPDRPNGITLAKISISMAPATIIEVALDSDFDPVAALGGHLLGEPLMAAWGMSSMAEMPKAASRLGKALIAGRLEDLQGKSVLRLVHAVQVPLMPPRQIEIVPVLVTVAPEEHATPTNPSWSGIVQANVAAGKSFEEWSQPGGASCFFVGQVGLDAPSTGSLGLDARWQDFGPEMVVWHARTNTWIEKATWQSGRMFSLTKLESDITRPNPGSEDEISLLEDRLHVLRGLSFSFRDGRARRLETRLMAVSRFTEYYDIDPPTGTKPGEPGPCERAALATAPIWVPCTFRPGALDIKRVTPWFTYHQTGEQGDQEFTFTRDVSYRVEMGRDGFTSGEDERMALVFPSGDPEVCDYAAETLKPFASCLTRWGRDPLHFSAVPQRNISPARFEGSLGRVDDLQLLPGTDPVDGSVSTAKPISATALPFKLKLDPKTGTYFSDIGIAPASVAHDAYMPFVQLGLARYQAHSVAGLELSLPVGTTVQLFPRRTGKVRFRKRSEGRRFSLQLSGQVDPGSKFHSVLDVTALVQVNNGHERPRWIPQVHDGKIVKLEGLIPNADGWTITNFEMPMDRYFSDHWLGLLIEEYEVHQDEHGNTHRRIVYGQIVDFKPAGGRSAATTDRGPGSGAMAEIATEPLATMET